MNQGRIIAALYDTGVLTQGKILDAYYNIFINIIYNKKIRCEKEEKLIELFKDELKIDFPSSFVRYIMSIGKRKGEVSYRGREYKFNIQREKERVNEFDTKLFTIGRAYQAYANKNKQYVNTNTDEELKELVMEYIGYLNDGNSNNKDLFWWSKFVLSLQTEKPELFEFISTIRFSMAYADFLFYNNYDEKYEGLRILIDTPILLGLLGFDDEERVKTARLLVEKLNSKNSKLEIFNNNYEEMERIIDQAKKYAYSSSYDSTKANNACKSMHDTMRIKYVENVQLKIEEELKKYNIEICDFDYDTQEYKYYEDERKLYIMIENRYNESLKNNEPDYKNESIEIDVRNINKIYLMRQGNQSTSLKNCKAILISTNYALFAISKDYKCNSNYLPAVVTTDYIIAMLFASDIRDVKEYRTIKLIEICTEITKPSADVYKKFIDTVNKQEHEGNLTGEQAVLLKNRAFTDPIISELTDNNPDNIVDETPTEVYEKIINGRMRDYEVLKSEKERESKHHEKEIENLKSEIDIITSKNEIDIKILNEQINQNDRNNKSKNNLRIRSAESLATFVSLVLGGVLLGLVTFIINTYFSTDIKMTIGITVVGLIAEFVLFKVKLYKEIKKFIYKAFYIDE